MSHMERYVNQMKFKEKMLSYINLLRPFPAGIDNSTSFLHALIGDRRALAARREKGGKSGKFGPNRQRRIYGVMSTFPEVPRRVLKLPARSRIIGAGIGPRSRV